MCRHSRLGLAYRVHLTLPHWRFEGDETYTYMCIPNNIPFMYESFPSLWASRSQPGPWTSLSNSPLPMDFFLFLRVIHRQLVRHSWESYREITHLRNSNQGLNITYKNATKFKSLSLEVWVQLCYINSSTLSIFFFFGMYNFHSHVYIIISFPFKP